MFIRYIYFLEIYIYIIRKLKKNFNEIKLLNKINRIIFRIFKITLHFL